MKISINQVVLTFYNSIYAHTANFLSISTLLFVLSSCMVQEVQE